MTLGLWHVWIRGWRMFLPVIAATAALQAITVFVGRTPGWDALFALLVIVSLSATIGAVALTAEQALAIVDGRPARLPGPTLVVWSAAAVLAVAIVGTLLPPGAPVAIVLAALVLPAPAAGHLSGFGALVVFAHRPLRAILTTVAALLVIGLSWVVALLLGFFVTGAIGAALTWAWFGLVGTVLLCATTVLYRRAVPA